MPAQTNIVFVENHHDVINREIYTKIVPQLKDRYNIFLDETLPTDTPEDGIKGTSEDVQAKERELATFKERLETSKIPTDLSEFNKKFENLPKKILLHYKKIYYDYLFLKSEYEADKQNNKFYHMLADNNFRYLGVDNEKGWRAAVAILRSSTIPEQQVEFIKNLIDKVREKDIAAAYLAAEEHFIGRIGFDHLKPIQERMLKRLSFEEIDRNFCFIHIHSSLPEMEFLKSMGPRFS